MDPTLLARDLARENKALREENARLLSSIDVQARREAKLGDELANYKRSVRGLRNCVSRLRMRFAGVRVEGDEVGEEVDKWLGRLKGRARMLKGLLGKAVEILEEEVVVEKEEEGDGEEGGEEEKGQGGEAAEATEE